MPLALRSIQKYWRRGFPYTERMPGVRVRLMQRITHELPRNEITLFSTRNTDIPYIFEAGEVEDRKRQREFHHMGIDDPASRRGWKRNKTGTEIELERDH
ncbi:hypothetical protein IMZ48_10360 [Candidatus Bathyarchaeota archaeon]|nr:hypothetical protein [Candidatus Bathyarchaeota archaeon]